MTAMEALASAISLTEAELGPVPNPYGEPSRADVLSFCAYLDNHPDPPELPKMVYVAPTPPEGFVQTVDDDGHVEYKCGCCGHPWDGD